MKCGRQIKKGIGNSGDEIHRRKKEVRYPKLPPAPVWNSTSYPIHGFPDRADVGGFPVHLVTGGEEEELHVPDGVELGVRFVRRIAEVLNLRHGELSYSDQAGTWGNLVPGVKK